MKSLTLSTLFLATSTLVSTSALATEYQSFTSFDYLNIDTPQVNQDVYSLSSIYFLDKKSSLGPLNEFEYINKTSNVFGQFSDMDNANTYSLGGEMFINKWLVGGSYNYIDHNNGSDDAYALTLGYLLSDNLLVKAEANKEGSDTFYQFSAAYNHQINDSDYIGFTYSTDDKFDSQTLSSKYFVAVGANQYLSLGASYTNNDGWDNNLAAVARFYFNNYTSISASYNDDDDYSISAKYFINKNYSVSAGYNSNASSNDNEDYDLYSLNFTAQF